MANGIRINVGASFDAKDLRKASRELEALGDELKGLDSRMMRVSRGFAKAGQTLTGIGSVMTQSITLPIVGAGFAVTKMAADFSESMSRIVGLVGLSADEVKGMEEAVLNLAGETGRAPRELADALFVVTSAGLRGADAMEALEFAAKAGAAGLGETRDIARAVAGAMNGYSSSNLDAARATDVLVATARAGNFETTQFAGALGNVLQFAPAAGISIEDLGGSIALLTRTNGDARKSINLLRALFEKFVIPTEQTRAVLSDLGIEMSDIRDIIQKDGLVAGLRALDNAVGGNKEELGRLLSSSEAAAAALEILNADAETLASTFGVTAEATGLTDEAFNVASEQSAFKFRKALNDLQVAGTELGAAFLPVATRIAEKISELARVFGQLTPKQQEFIIQTGLFVAAIGPAITFLGLMSFAVAGLTAMVAKLGIAVTIATGGLAVLGAIAGVAALKAHFAELGIVGMNDAMLATRQDARDAANEMELFDRKLFNTVLAANDAELALLNLRSEMALATLDPATGSDPEARSARAAINEQERERIRLAMELQKQERELAEEMARVEAEIKASLETTLDDTEATKGATAAKVALTRGMREFFQQLNETNVGVSGSRDMIAQFAREVLAAGNITDETARGAENLARAIRQNLDKALADANRRLDEALGKFNAYSDAIAGGVRSGNTIADAVRNQTAAQEALTAAQEAYEQAKSGDDVDAIKDAADALKDAEKAEGTFLSFLETGVTTAEGFAAQIDAVREAGASMEVVQQIAELGAKTGGRIASELLAGGAAAIEQANQMVIAVENASRRAGESAAQQFFGAGVNAARAMVRGIEATIPELQSVLDRIAEAIERALGARPNVKIDGTGRSFIEPSPTPAPKPPPTPKPNFAGRFDPLKFDFAAEKMAVGGFVTGPTFAMVGEAGPEVVMPLDWFESRYGGGGGNTINITVTSADPQAVVEALRKYTRANGPLGAVVTV